LSPRHEEANNLLQRIEQVNRRRVDDYIRRGNEYFDAKDWNRAAEEYDKALALDPKNKIAQQKRRDALSQIDLQQLFEQAQAYYKQNQFAKAIELYNRILERDPSHSAAHAKLEESQRQLNFQVEKYFNRGMTYYTAEDYESAIREWQKALNINPNHKLSLEYTQQAQQRLDALKQLRE
jgi:tetratricopeptide (TPR) repeat protein